MSKLLAFSFGNEHSFYRLCMPALCESSASGGKKSTFDQAALELIKKWGNQEQEIEQWSMTMTCDSSNDAQKDSCFAGRR
jgi:hypothetical protein